MPPSEASKEQQSQERLLHTEMATCVTSLVTGTEIKVALSDVTVLMGWQSPSDIVKASLTWQTLTQGFHVCATKKSDIRGLVAAAGVMKEATPPERSQSFDVILERERVGLPLVYALSFVSFCL